jgi:hypothetical protein
MKLNSDFISNATQERKYTNNPLLFKRQFMLSSSPEFGFSDWNNIKLNDSAYLSVHPELEVNQSSYNSIRLTLLGFIVDPFAPDKSNKEVLDQIVKGAKNFEDVVANTNALAGRWIILYLDANSFKMFNDPCGQRRAYYFKNGDGFLCGSDPSIIGHFVKLEEDKSKDIQEFVTSPNFESAEHCWMGEDTIYTGVKHLMPNHYLDLRQWKAIRYWPNKHLEKIDLMQGVEIASAILKGTLLAASKRQPLAMAVTSGWDSRVLLAASKEICNDVTYFVSEDPESSPLDTIIPSKLFKDLGLPFEVQLCKDKEVLDPEFISYLKKSVTLSRAKYYNNIYKYYTDFKGKLNVNGNVSEVVRIVIYPTTPMKLSGAAFASVKYLGYKNLHYPAVQMDKWLDDIHPLCIKYGYNILDINYWEQRMGNWQTLYSAEQDLAMDCISPFNNRFLLTTLLGVDIKYRIHPNFTLYTEIIKNLWPEVLSQPVGKKTFKAHTKNLIRQTIMHLTGVYSSPTI